MEDTLTGRWYGTKTDEWLVQGYWDEAQYLASSGPDDQVEANLEKLTKELESRGYSLSRNGHNGGFYWKHNPAVDDEDVRLAMLTLDC